MIIHDVQQGSLDWMRARLGIPTASEFGSIITPTGNPSKQADEYANWLLAEMILGHPIEDFTGTKWTERGQEVEQNAVQFYEFQRELQVQEVGFVTDDAYTMGCSPDRLIGEDGVLEIKCLKANNHISILLEQAHDPKHRPQIQGMLYIMERKWVDIEYFHPTLPTLIIRAERDEPYLAAMREYLDKFRREFVAKKQQMVDLGYLSIDSQKAA